MRIKTVPLSYEEVLALPKSKRPKPKRPGFLLRSLVRLLSASDLKKVHFSYRSLGMEQLKSSEPCLTLMTHSSFIDLKIASRIFYPRPLSIVCTSDGFV